MCKLISIAMCTYNGEKFIEKQLLSILNQTYTNIEIIIVDDGSSDSTIDIIKKISDTYNCIKLYQNKFNLGFIKNFEKAISLSKGDYISLSDQDDIWEFNKIERLINKIENTDSLLIYSNALLVDDNLISSNKTLLDEIIPIQGKNNLYFLYNNSISGNTMLFKKDLLIKVLPFPEDIVFHDLWISFVASCYSDICYIDEPLIKYRQHSNNITDIDKRNKIPKNYKKKIEKKMNSHIVFMKKLKNYIFYLENNLPNHDNLSFLVQILDEYSKYEKYYFNIKLFRLIIGRKDELFFSKKEITLSRIIKMCTGIRTFKLLPFI
jgi:glycosyltransferase involved in cell wall biosynthesis